MLLGLDEGHQFARIKLFIAINDIKFIIIKLFIAINDIKFIIIKLFIAINDIKLIIKVCIFITVILLFLYIQLHLYY